MRAPEPYASENTLVRVAPPPNSTPPQLKIFDPPTVTRGATPMPY